MVKGGQQITFHMTEFSLAVGGRCWWLGKCSVMAVVCGRSLCLFVDVLCFGREILGRRLRFLGLVAVWVCCFSLAWFRVAGFSGNLEVDHLWAVGGSVLT